MKQKRHSLAIYSRTETIFLTKILTIEEFSREVGVHASIIESYLDLGILSPAEFKGDTPLFDEEAIYRLRRIQRLRNNLGVNLAGAGIISDLMEEIEELKEEIGRLRGK